MPSFLCSEIFRVTHIDCAGIPPKYWTIRDVGFINIVRHTWIQWDNLGVGKMIYSYMLSTTRTGFAICFKFVYPLCFSQTHILVGANLSWENESTPQHGKGAKATKGVCNAVRGILKWWRQTRQNDDDNSRHFEAFCLTERGNQPLTFYLFMPAKKEKLLSSVSGPILVIICSFKGFHGQQT